MAKQYTGSQEVIIPVEPLLITIDVVDDLPVARRRVLISRNTGLLLIDPDTDNLLISRGF